MTEITLNITKKDKVETNLVELIAEDNITELIKSLKAMKEKSNSRLTELVEVDKAAETVKPVEKMETVTDPGAHSSEEEADLDEETSSKKPKILDELGLID